MRRGPGSTTDASVLPLSLHEQPPLATEPNTANIGMGMSSPAWRLRPRGRCGHRGRITPRGKDE
jgi:hypothetical protein